ncbi:hypothetical protein ABZY09_30465 [Streptomyces sp. NPDC002928]|uniref:hypothetical protein n=1 Tax=Streptomyces sp. NPDC002928 TaxID=3154440 RepID=UPI00339E4F05
MLNAILNMGVPTKVFSTDSGEDTIQSRILARAASMPTSVTEDWLRSDPEKCARLLAPFDFIDWDFRPDPTLDDIWHGLYAYHEEEGQYPAQTVIDIASDVGHDTGDEWGSLRDLMRQAKVISRETGTHLLLVHHAADSERTKRPCPRRSDIHGKVNAIPELIVTCGVTNSGDLHVACVKNRHAKADIDANNHFPMSLNAETSMVSDYVSQPHAYASWNQPGEDSW